MKSTLPPVGQVFGRLTVIGLGERKYYWSCQCNCGQKKEIAAHRIIHGQSKSCGCLRREVKRDLNGKRFGRWTVIKHVENKPTICICQCDCGSPPRKVQGKLLLAGESKSCGCYRLEKLREKIKTHSMSREPIYRSWVAMVSRCHNPENNAYNNYGARGIKVCEKWRKFEGFIEDMGERPPGKTLERIDNDGDYCKENCKWANAKTQSRNKRSNVWITLDGKTQIIADWAKELGIPASTITYRIKSGWTTEEALGRKSKKKEA